MKGTRYTAEFKAEAIKQVTERGHGIRAGLNESHVLCSRHSLNQHAQLKSARGYKHPRYKSGKPAIAAPNQLGQQFTFTSPDQA
jgi:transposase-like protein